MISKNDSSYDGLSSKIELSNLLIGINKRYLNNKPHIKKYNKIRNLHGEVIDSMVTYLQSGKYNAQKYFDIIRKDTIKETGEEINISLSPMDINDETIIEELFIYKNHRNIPSIIEIYISQNKFKDKTKMRLLQSMKKSHVGLFKVVSVDIENGYVIYEDVFTKHKYKIVDIALSSTFNTQKNTDVYMYNRIITFDGISFTAGIHCMISSKNKELKEFIKKHDYYKCSDFSRCLQLYKISKEDNKVAVNYNNEY